MYMIYFKKYIISKVFFQSIKTTVIIKKLNITLHINTLNQLNIFVFWFRPKMSPVHREAFKSWLYEPLLGPQVNINENYRLI